MNNFKKIAYLNRITMKNKLSELAGSWKMSDKEVDTFLENIREGWRKYKIKL